MIRRSLQYIALVAVSVLALELYTAKSVNAQSVCSVAFQPCGGIVSGAIGQLSGLLLENVNTYSTSNLLTVKYNGATTYSIGYDGIPNLLSGVFTSLRSTPGTLTTSTMTPVVAAEVREVVHSFAWTNAMVVALGASLTGDINVVTLPAKTRVTSAIVVIDTPATDANTLTVSCGDTGAGATNYVLAGDAKAAANTVYGDLISGAETGAALFDATAKWIPVYMPSYTATTTVSCRFTKTVTNLNTVTGSSGRVILTTTLLP